MVLERLGVILVFLYMIIDQVDEIIFGCDINIIRFDDRDIIMYLVFVINCMVLIYEFFIFDVIKDNKSVVLCDYFDIGCWEILLVNMMIVSFNSIVMSNENVVLNLLMFRIYSY